MIAAPHTGLRLPAPAALRRLARPARFVGAELALWGSIYLGYLAVRGATVGGAREAVANARDLLALEGAIGIGHEASVQGSLGFAHDALSAYYMAGFAPLIVAVLVWTAIHRRDVYRRLRTLLLVSITLALIGYVFYPTAPPRLVPELGMADTVGLSNGHDNGSFAGVRFNPYAAMPSMHVGWSLLVGIVGFAAARRRLVRALSVAHPAVMTVTVTATGNHYFVDSIAGALVALAGVAVVWAFARRPRRAGVGAGTAPAPTLRRWRPSTSSTAPSEAATTGELRVSQLRSRAGPATTPGRSPAPAASSTWSWTARRCSPRNARVATRARRRSSSGCSHDGPARAGLR